MTIRATSYHRILSSILALVMIFTMSVELIQPVSAAAPTLQLKKISNIYDGSIYVTGTLECSRANKINAYGLLYGENSPEENKAVISSTKEKTYTGTKSISTTVSGMTPGKNYVCCLYAETTGGTIYKSETMAFTSSSISVAQPQVNNITYNSAKISAVYTKTGSCPVKEVGFYYGTDKNCTKKIKASKSTKITKQLQSLESGRTYYYYAYVLSEAGNLYKSEIQTFQTISRSATGVTLRTSVGSVSSWKDNPKEKSVHLYDEFHIEAEIRPDYAQNKNVTFSTSDPSILQIGKSRVKAVAPGQATLTATTEDGGITASLLIAVKDKPDWDEVPVITSVRADGENSVTLKWKRPSCFWPDEKVIYIVYRADKRNGNYKEVERTTQTSTTDDTLDPDTTYFYKIQAYEKSDDLYQFTYFSDVVSVTTKEHVYVPKNMKDNASKNDNVIAPDPVEVIPFPDNENNIIAPDPVEITPIFGTESNVIAPDPVSPQTSLAPMVNGLAAAYTIEKGGKLSLRFTVEDAAGGIVEKVTVKHNASNSACSISLTNSSNGVMECVFDIQNSLFHNVGTYNFNVYAKATNFTVTDNRIGSFTVTVVDMACRHLEYDDVYNRTEYTDIILTDNKHTSYIVYDRICKDCGVPMGEINAKTETTGHTVNKKGYCDCGYINVSGYTPEKAHNKTVSTQNIYRNPESWGWYGSINANENVTILGEWGERYLIEYSLDGGGVKQGYVPMNILQKETEDKAPVEASYSLSINSVYFYKTFEGEPSGLLVGCINEAYKVDIIDNATGQKVNYSSNPDLYWKFRSNIGLSIDQYGTLCLTPLNNNITMLELYCKDKLQDVIGIIVADRGDRLTNLKTVLADERWSEDGIALHSLCNAINFSAALNPITRERKFTMDFYNDIPMVFGVASYYPNGELCEMQLVDGYWEELSVTDTLEKAAISVVDLFNGKVFKGMSEATTKKTTIDLRVPKGGYVRTLYSSESEYVLFANFVEFCLGSLDTVEDFKEIFTICNVSSLRDCIDKEAFIINLSEELANDKIIDELKKAFALNSLENVTQDLSNIISSNNIAEKIVRIACDCIKSVEAGAVVKTISKKAENVALSFIKPAYYIMNGGEAGIDTIQIANLIKRNMEVMKMADATREIGFCIWYPNI